MLIAEVKRERRNPDGSSPSKESSISVGYGVKRLLIRNMGKQEVAAPGEKAG